MYPLPPFPSLHPRTCSPHPRPRPKPAIHTAPPAPPRHSLTFPRQLLAVTPLLLTCAHAHAPRHTRRVRSVARVLPALPRPSPQPPPLLPRRVAPHAQRVAAPQRTSARTRLRLASLLTLYLLPPSPLLCSNAFTRVLAPAGPPHLPLPSSPLTLLLVVGGCSPLTLPRCSPPPVHPQHVYTSHLPPTNTRKLLFNNCLLMVRPAAGAVGCSCLQPQAKRTPAPAQMRGLGPSTCPAPPIVCFLRDALFDSRLPGPLAFTPLRSVVNSKRVDSVSCHVGRPRCTVYSSPILQLLPPSAGRSLQGTRESYAYDANLGYTHFNSNSHQVQDNSCRNNETRCKPLYMVAGCA